MPKISLWFVMMCIIAAGIAGGLYIEPTHTAPLLGWTVVVATVFAIIEKIVRRGH
jgi:hypothetical protein